MGAALWIGCGWCAGDAARHAVEGRLDALTRTVGLLRRIRQEVACRRTDLGLFYQKLLQEGKFHSDDGTLQGLCPPRALAAREAACFRECFSDLGRAEASRECARLDFYIACFEDLLRAAQAEAAPQLRLTRQLGVGAGLAATILFL